MRTIRCARRSAGGNDAEPGDYGREGGCAPLARRPGGLRTLEAFELRDGEWGLIGLAKDGEPVNIRPFDAITFSLGDLRA